MMSIIEVAFIRFYISLLFIKNLQFPRDTQPLSLFRRRPPWLKRKIVPSNKTRGYVPSARRLDTTRHVGRVAISKGMGSNGKHMLAVLCIQRVNKIHITVFLE